DTRSSSTGAVGSVVGSVGVVGGVVVGSPVFVPSPVPSFAFGAFGSVVTGAGVPFGSLGSGVVPSGGIAGAVTLASPVSDAWLLGFGSDALVAPFEPLLLVVGSVALDSPALTVPPFVAWALVVSAT